MYADISIPANFVPLVPGQVYLGQTIAAKGNVLDYTGANKAIAADNDSNGNKLPEIATAGLLISETGTTFINFGAAATADSIPVGQGKSVWVIGQALKTLNVFPDTGLCKIGLFR